MNSILSIEYRRVTRSALAIAGVLALAACSSDSGSGGGGSSDSGASTGGDAAATGDSAGGTGGGTCKYAGEYANEKCNPMCPTESGCAEGANCTFVGSGFGCESDGTQPLAKGCNDETLCAEGGCVEIEGLGKKCSAFCKVDADCPPEWDCRLEVGYGGTAPILMCSPKPPSCSVFNQDCVEAGTACYLAGGTECLEEGEAKLGDDCADPNGCVKGLICVSDRCHQPCSPKTGGVAAELRCMFKCPGSFANIQGVDNVAICSLPDNEPPCDLLGQSDCEDGEACYYTTQGPRCRKAGKSPVSSPCEGENDCVQGAVCWPDKCVSVCNPADGLHEECANPGSPCSGLPGSNAGFCDE